MLKVLHITSGIQRLGCYHQNHTAKLFLRWISKWKQVLNWKHWILIIFNLFERKGIIWGGQIICIYERVSSWFDMKEWWKFVIMAMGFATGFRQQKLHISSIASPFRSLSSLSTGKGRWMVSLIQCGPDVTEG